MSMMQEHFPSQVVSELNKSSYPVNPAERRKYKKNNDRRFICLTDKFLNWNFILFEATYRLASAAFIV